MISHELITMNRQQLQIAVQQNEMLAQQMQILELLRTLVSAPHAQTPQAAPLATAEQVSPDVAGRISTREIRPALALLVPFSTR